VIWTFASIAIRNLSLMPERFSCAQSQGRRKTGL
jgi:hypothetical protein